MCSQQIWYICIFLYLYIQILNFNLILIYIIYILYYLYILYIIIYISYLYLLNIKLHFLF